MKTVQPSVPLAVRANDIRKYKGMRVVQYSNFIKLTHFVLSFEAAVIKMHNRVEQNKGRRQNTHSLHGSYARSELPLGGLDHVSVDLGHLGQPPQHLDARLLLGHVVVDGVAHEQHVAQVREVGL